MKKFSAFSGYDSQAMVFPMETVGTSEVDEWAILASAAIHYDASIEIDYPSIDKILERFIARNISFNFKTGVNPWIKILEKGKYSEKMITRIHNLFKACILTKNFGDISLIDPKQIPDHDLATYSFPCQDISMAGLQKGLEEGSGSRSSLLWEFKKIVVAKRPKFLMMENVKNLVGKKHKADFDRWLNVLEELGYNNYWKVINAKNCGVPQNRERVFCVSILKSADNGKFKFYDDFDNGVRLKDVLENEVDDKYYLSDEKCESLIKTLTSKEYTDYKPNNLKMIGMIPKEVLNDNERQRRVYDTEGISPSVLARTDSAKIINVGKLDMKGSEQVRRVYSSEGISPTLDTMQGGHRQPKIVEACAIRGRNSINPKSRKSGLETVQMLEVSKNPDINNCLTTVQKDTMLLEKPSFRIRKLTPAECFRLMGVKDSDIDKIKSTGISNSQMYKLAGNSIVVPCMNFLKQLRGM